MRLIIQRIRKGIPQKRDNKTVAYRLSQSLYSIVVSRITSRNAERTAAHLKFVSDDNHIKTEIGDIDTSDRRIPPHLLPVTLSLIIPGNELVGLFRNPKQFLSLPQDTRQILEEIKGHFSHSDGFDRSVARLMMYDKKASTISFPPVYQPSIPPTINSSEITRKVRLPYK